MCEELEVDNSVNSIYKKPVTKEDKDESISIYLGKENLEALKSMTSDEYKKFKSFNLNPSKNSYFVKGDRKSLLKFRAFFVALCAYERYSYSTFMIKDYIEGLAERNDDLSFLAGAERELLFLYVHGESSGTGNSEIWLASSTVDRIASRKRKGLITVVLSERSFPIIEASEDVEVINLTNVKISKSRNMTEESYRKNNEARKVAYTKSEQNYTNTYKSSGKKQRIDTAAELMDNPHSNALSGGSNETEEFFGSF